MIPMRGAHADSLGPASPRHAAGSDIRWRHAAQPPRTIRELLAAVPGAEPVILALLIVLALAEARREDHNLPVTPVFYTTR
jgi:hypothetical protein